MSDTILIVDDERMLVETISYNLQKEGFLIATAHDGETALQQAKNIQPQLVILDLMLPKISGWEVCRALRQSSDYKLDAPILMLTARGEESDKVLGLELGADDYLVKPFGMRELVARVRALLRRSAKAATSNGEILQSGSVALDVARHEVRVCDGEVTREVNLSLKEFELLRVLLTHAGNAVPREVLLERVWGDDFYGDERTLDVHIRWLREKLEKAPSQPEFLLTVRGVGYKFKS
ncbi:DNA-binding response regulator [Abditibacterium utsteinense]|uniref:Phosphate regulon transcriptional regulatory protein PhoB n=1 Tax=Abditibacterium utsteinense TaxID=1960156 RepID=A0A2S8SVL7_9BACT|nr:response regulator transcription factor [Abditibacterium utsteinense]PQV64832.1 DNA-binding response regulator [Abditibacterium utsteinense]